MKIYINTFLFTVLLFFTVKSFSQDFKFGKVSKEELLETRYKFDSTANAAVLYKEKVVYFQNFQLITEVFERIKVYNKNGFEHASHGLFLYKQGNGKERLSGLKAITYNLLGDEVVETKLSKDEIFENEYSERYDELKFTMPALKEGSVIEYKYKIVSPFIFNIGKISLQYDIPIKKLDIKVKMIKPINFKRFMTGYLPINFKESLEGSQVTVNSIRSNHIPAFKEEPYSGNVNNYKSSIVYDLQYIRFPNGVVENFSSTWEDVTKKVYKNYSFGKELEKSNYYKPALDSLLVNVNTPSQKIDVIYNYVKNKMTWNEYRSVYTRKGVRKAYKENMGNSAEINLMLTSMLNYSGLNSNPVLVSTEDKPFPLFPSLRAYNYVISRVKLPNGDIIYLDATDKYGLPNILPNRVIGGSGRVIAENGTSERIDLRPQKPSLNRYTVQCEIDAEGSVKGKFNRRYSKYSAHDFRVYQGSKDDEAKKKYFIDKYDFAEIDGYKITGVNECDKDVSESFSFTKENGFEVIENEIYFSPLLFMQNKENVFKSEERNYPIDYNYGFTNAYMVNIKIPEGYEVEEFPKSGAFRLPENLGSFTFRSNVNNGYMQVMVNETINSSLIPATYYPVLKQFYNQIIEKEGEQVVLKKI